MPALLQPVADFPDLLEVFVRVGEENSCTRFGVPPPGVRMPQRGFGSKPKVVARATTLGQDDHLKHQRQGRCGRSPPQPVPG